MPKRGKKRINKQVQKPRLTKNEKNEANASASIISTVTAELLEPPVKSLMDDNNYRVIKLANGLTAMLVSCPQHEYSKVTYTSLPEKQKNGSNGATDKVSFEEEDPGWSQRMKEKKRCITKVAYFELCVTVGSFNDPREVPGASSILSKILLKKSKKYSDENDDLGSWLLHRDASARIYGYAEKTVYSFETQLKHLTETLDRFAQNLISPLILPAEVERIRNDILHYSELELKGMMAPGPKQYLFYNLLSPRHSARVYGRDYLEGLRQPNEDEVYKEVVNFRERHYSAHRMTIVLKAELSLDTLEGYIKEYFSKIPNNDQPLNEFNQFNFLNSFERSKYGRLYKLNSYVPVDVAEFSLFGLRKKPTKRIELTWSMPPRQWLYKNKSECYLAWLIAQEGKGSLINYLRKKKLCTGIACGVGDKKFEDNSIYSLFSLTLTLTDEGRKEYIKVLDTIFSYFVFLRGTALEPKIYEELSQIEENRFRYNHNPESDQIGTDSKYLSVNMHFYPPTDYLTGKCLYFEYDPVAISAYMKFMSPERANIILYEETSENIQTGFPSAKIPEEWLVRWENSKPLPDFALPEPNIYIADDFTLISVDEKTPRTPVKIFHDVLNIKCEIWYGIGTEFRSPMCYINFFFMSPRPMASPGNCAMTDMLFIILQNILNEKLYSAKAAGMTFTFSRCRSEGIYLEITGFSQKLPLLMESIAKLIGDWSNLITNDLFETTKKRVLAAYEERILENLMTQNLTEDLRLSILKVGHWTRMDKHAALSTIQMLRFQGFVKQFFHYVYVKCLAQGNITSEDVSTNVQKFIAISKCGSLSPNMSLQVKIVEIPIGEKYCRIQNFVEKCTTVIVSNYYQSPIHNTEAILKVDLLTSIITDELFEELRQCVELESIGSQICHDEGVVGYNIVMWEVLQEEEKSKTPQELDVDIEDHRATLHSLFGQITDKEWGDILDVFMDHKKLPRDSKHLVSEVTRNWGEITAGTYLFNREEHDLNAIKKMTIEDVRRWMLFLTSRGGKIQKLSVQVDCAGPPETATSSQHKYSLKYKCGLHKPMVEGRQFINCIPTFKSSLKVLPRPDTP